MAGPEKVMIFLDTSDEMLEKLGPRSRMENAKRALTMFVTCKLRVNPATEFAIYALDTGVRRLLDFTAAEQRVLQELWDLKTGPRFPSLDLEPVFEAVAAHPKLRPILSDTSAAACVRGLMVYGRSSIVPRNVEAESVKRVLRMPNFFFDALYLHDKPASNNCCQEVYDQITLLEDEARAGRGYFCENSTSAKKLFQSATLFLAHPRQRTEQADLQDRLREAPPVGPPVADDDLIELPG